MLKGYDDALAKDCLDTAIKAWNEEKVHPTQFPAAAGGFGGSAPAGGVLAASQGVVSGARNGRSGAPAGSGTANTQAAPAPSRGAFGVGQDWAAALELTIVTHGAEPYKSRLKELFPQMIASQQMGFHGWTAVRALPYPDASAKDQLREAEKTYMADQDKQLTPPRLVCLRVWAPGKPRIHTSRRKLHPRHAPGIQHFLCSGRRYGL